MKLDMGKAWNDAMAMISANSQMVLIVAGAFFFLPYLALGILLPEAAQPDIQGDPSDMDAAMAALQSVYADNWWSFLLVFVAQAVGTLALLVVLSDPSRPTVGDAISRAFRSFPSYLAAQIMLGLAIGLGIALPLVLASLTGSGALIAIIAIAAFVLAIYLFVKFSLTTPVIAVDQMLNPLRALGRSWRLTKGNSVRIFAFFLLILIAFMVVAILVTLVLGVVFAAVGGQFEVIGNALVSSLVNAVYVTLFLAVLGAVHRQLSGPSAREVSDTFE